MKRRDFLLGTIGTAVTGSMAVLGPIPAMANLVPDNTDYLVISVPQVMQMAHDKMNASIDKYYSDHWLNGMTKGELSLIQSGYKRSKYSYITLTLRELMHEALKANQKLLLIVRQHDLLWKRHLPSAAFAYVPHKIMIEQEDGSYKVVNAADRFSFSISALDSYLPVGR